MEPYLQKQQLRKEYKAQRSRWSDDERRQISAGILEQARQLKLYEDAQVIFCYVGTSEEIDTIPLIQDAWSQGKRVGAPRCVGKGQMTVQEIFSLEDLLPGKFGILEPKEQQPVILPERIDLAFLPCLACSKKGVRLGYGGGYYDRYLPQVQGRKMALCAAEQVCEELPKEPHDCAAEGIVTENFVIFC